MSFTSKAHPNRRVLRSLTACVTGAALVTTGSVALSGPATAATPQNDVVEVNDASTSWAEQAYECTDTGANLTPQQNNVAGPQRAPFGSGSHHIRISEYSTQTELYRTDAYDGTPLADLSRLEYSTHASPLQADQPDRQPTYMRLNVDTDGDQTRDDSLFFIPANNAEQQPVENGVWQNWDVANGDISVNGDSGPSGTTTLAQYSDAHPGATLVNNDQGKVTGGAVALITGCGQGGDTDPQRNGDYFVDRVIVGTKDAPATGSDTDTLYDFEGPTETNQGTTMQTVDPDHDGPWTSQAYDYQTGATLRSNQTFVTGPATPPQNRGSLRFTVSDDTNPNRIEQFRSTTFDGRLLRDVRGLSYSTYVHGFDNNPTPQQPPYLYLRVDNDGNGSADDVLFFYPANNADQQPVAPDQWQSWDAANGRWNLGGDDGPANAFTLDQYLAEHPDAVIVNNSTDPSWSGGGVTIQVGAGGTGQTNGHYYVDDVTMSTADAQTSSTVSGTEYDLEPAAQQPSPSSTSVSINDTSVQEGNSGTAAEKFTVSLDQPSKGVTTVDYATDTARGTADERSDYTPKAGMVTFQDGQQSKTVTVAVNGDKAFEPDENLWVHLSNPQGSGNPEVTKANGKGAIVNDDTKVTANAENAAGTHIRVGVNTTPDAAGKPVKIYQQDAGDDTVLWSGKLDTNGHVSQVPAKEFHKGNTVRVYAVVTTSNGDYASSVDQVTID